MTAIQLGPQHDTLSRLYDPPEPRMRLTPRTLGAFTAVALLYAGGGMLLNLAGIQFKIPFISDPKPITFVAWEPPPPVTVDPLPVTRSQPAFADPVLATNNPVEVAPTIIDPTPSTLDNLFVAPGPGVETPVTTAPVAVAPVEPVAPASIRNPAWLTKPTADQLARVYPRRAAERGRSGAVTMECRVTALGTVDACSVLEELPKGLGFGEAALSSTRWFRMSPRTVGGEPVEGAKVRIPMGFLLTP